MDKTPLISIIIPAYNHEKYVEQCLNSILEEDYPNKEIVIIDDGSKDKTAQIIEKWIEQHKNAIPVNFKSRENKGVSKTLNELWDLANGEYIVSVASDDYLYNNGISKRYEYLQIHPEKFAVFGDCIVIDEEGNKILNSCLTELHKANKQNYETDQGIKEEIIANWSISGPVLMMRKEIYKKIGKFNEKLKVEDWDFYLRMVSKDLLGFTDEIIAAYRVHGLNFSMNKSSQSIIYNDCAKTALCNLKNFNGKYRKKLFLKYRDKKLLELKTILMNNIENSHNKYDFKALVSKLIIWIMNSTIKIIRH